VAVGRCALGESQVRTSFFSYKMRAGCTGLAYCRRHASSSYPVGSGLPGSTFRVGGGHTPVCSHEDTEVVLFAFSHSVIWLGVRPYSSDMPKVKPNQRRRGHLFYRFPPWTKMGYRAASDMNLISPESHRRKLRSKSGIVRSSASGMLRPAGKKVQYVGGGISRRLTARGKETAFPLTGSGVQIQACLSREANDTAQASRNGGTECYCVARRRAAFRRGSRHVGDIVQNLASASKQCASHTCWRKLRSCMDCRTAVRRLADSRSSEIDK
jgi:hypothetical protein